MILNHYEEFVKNKLQLKVNCLLMFKNVMFSTLKLTKLLR